MFTLLWNHVAGKDISTQFATERQFFTRLLSGVKYTSFMAPEPMIVFTNSTREPSNARAEITVSFFIRILWLSFDHHDFQGDQKSSHSKRERRHSSSSPGARTCCSSRHKASHFSGESPGYCGWRPGRPAAECDRPPVWFVSTVPRHILPERRRPCRFAQEVFQTPGSAQDGQCCFAPLFHRPGALLHGKSGGTRAVRSERGWARH